LQKIEKNVLFFSFLGAGHFVTSQRMLMKHIGFNTSTTMHRYDEDQYQCGWRQPFNGEGDVITL